MYKRPSYCPPGSLASAKLQQLLLRSGAGYTAWVSCCIAGLTGICGLFYSTSRRRLQEAPGPVCRPSVKLGRPGTALPLPSREGLITGRPCEAFAEPRCGTPPPVSVTRP
jgi:hypothetical protein